MGQTDAELVPRPMHASAGREGRRSYAGGEGKMNRFLSETGEWDLVEGAPLEHPLARRIAGDLCSDALAFGGRLWWVDLSCGAMSADPFSDRLETRCVELPKGSVLPAGAYDEAWRALPMYLRVGVSEGRLRYEEVSQREPFMLSSFALDEERGGWTLEYRVALGWVWADGGYPWLPLRGEKTPRIAVLDPLNANVVHLVVGGHVVVVDMRMGKVTGISRLPDGHGSLGYIPCVLPPCLGSSRMPSIGKKDITENKTLADVLVRSDRHQKK